VGRKKKDVLCDLPNKIRSMVYLDVNTDVKKLSDTILTQIEQLSERRELIKSIGSDEGRDDEKKRILEEMKKTRDLLLHEIEEFRKKAFEQKKEKILEFVNDMIENGIKVVIFCYHKQAVSYFCENLSCGKAVITGDVSSEEREKEIERFQNDENCKVAICTLRAAGTGITLTAGNVVVFAEYDWNPAVILQAEDRVHRVSQENDVNVYYFVLKNTIDENFVVTLLRKAEKGLVEEFSFDYFIKGGSSE